LHNLKELGGMLHVAGEFYLRKPTVQITFLLVFNVVVWWSNQHCYLERKFKEYLPMDFFAAIWLENKIILKKKTSSQYFYLHSRKQFLKQVSKLNGRKLIIFKSKFIHFG
jgi:hypothetical protein